MTGRAFSVRGRIRRLRRRIWTAAVAAVLLTAWPAASPAGAVGDPPAPVTGNATYFDALGSPYGGCGMPQSQLDSQDFVALNVYDTPGDYNFYPRPLTGANASKTGMWNNGLNCGRFVQVQISDFCTGVNDGGQNSSFCRNGSWVSDAYNGATLTMIVADSCGDSNGWCRDDRYHLDLSKPSLNRFVKNGAPVGDMYPNHWNNRRVTWSFIPAPNYSGDIRIGFLKGSQAYWTAIAISHLPNGIHGVEYYADGAWQPAQMNSDMGQSYLISGTSRGATTFRIRVRDAADQPLNGGRVYSFGLPSSCGTQCAADYTEASYTTSTSSPSASPSASPSPSVSPSVSPSPSPSPSVSPSPSPSASPSASPSGSTGTCQVSYQVASSWQGGFTANVTVKNTGTTTWPDWTVGWTMPAGVGLVSGWSATVTASGSRWTARAPSWGQTLAPGASASFGFQASGSSSPGATAFTCP
ncbi:cellulose-binding protein [Microbispora cellulosiformans]|uniref:Cellulose-binding protein n=1 Tax=Microbispora cellulosiformans TaxID=2614688 RepID=A0A5J5K5J2_9ACTN|nr:cellulose binding domain-containing protein [Microbispora cellulosiformans]KAA9378386.1 cellulose-binding protein [Microbispora cellulosiformans]